MVSEFENKIMVITGAAQGIGKAIAQSFLQHKAKVIVIDIQKPDFQCSYFYQGDISQKEVLETFCQNVLEKFPSIDYLVNNACVKLSGITNSSYEEFLYAQQVGVVAPFMLSKLFKEHFNDGGTIINMASTRVFQSQANTECYSAIKGGIIALTHSMAVSFKHQIRVNAISPGWINTTHSTVSNSDEKQHLVSRVGACQDIVNAVEFLCSCKSSFINGENLVIDGGMSKLMIYHDDHGWSYQA